MTRCPGAGPASTSSSPLYYGIFLALLIAVPLMHWYWSWQWLAWPLYLGNYLRFVLPAVLMPGSWLELAADAHLSGSRFPHNELFLGHL